MGRENYLHVKNTLEFHFCVKQKVIRNDCRGFNNLSVWKEFDYRVDVCRITKGAHIEYL